MIGYEKLLSFAGLDVRACVLVSVFIKTLSHTQKHTHTGEFREREEV